MPLLDHFRPPVSERLPWSSLFNGWSCRIADELNVPDLKGPCLPDEYVAYNMVTLHGHPEVDSDSYDKPIVVGATDSQWTVPNADRSYGIIFPECVEVRVHRKYFPECNAVVVLVAPGNKESAASRIGLAARCLGYLQTGAAVVLVDIVTGVEGNVHHDILRLLGMETAISPDLGNLYAVAYRPAERKAGTQLDVWTYPLAMGSRLPTVPLRVIGDMFLPVDLEATYTEACRRRRLLP